MPHCTRLLQHQLSSESMEAGNSHSFGQHPMQEAVGQEHLSVQTPSRGVETSSLRLGNRGESFQVQAVPSAHIAKLLQACNVHTICSSLAGGRHCVTVNSKAAVGMQYLMLTALTGAKRAHLKCTAQRASMAHLMSMLCT